MNEIFVQFIALMTVVCSLAIKIIGYPDQIRKIIQTKQVNNLSSLHFGLSFITYIFWTLHGIIQQDWVIIGAQALGILSSGILLGLILYYKNKKL